MKRLIIFLIALFPFFLNAQDNSIIEGTRNGLSVAINADQAYALLPKTGGGAILMYDGGKRDEIAENYAVVMAACGGNFVEVTPSNVSLPPGFTKIGINPVWIKEATPYSGGSRVQMKLPKVAYSVSEAPTYFKTAVSTLLCGAGGGGGTDDQTAVEVPITDTGGFYTGTEVEAALQENGDSLAQHRTELDTKLETEVDGSVTNELQTVANTSDATTHTVTLSNSGGSFKIAEGANITITTSGTSADGVATIASTGGGSSIDSTTLSSTNSTIQITETPANNWDIDVDISSIKASLDYQTVTSNGARITYRTITGAPTVTMDKTVPLTPVLSVSGGTVRLKEVRDEITTGVSINPTYTFNATWADALDTPPSNVQKVTSTSGQYDDDTTPQVLNTVATTSQCVIQINAVSVDTKFFFYWNNTE